MRVVGSLLALVFVVATAVPAQAMNWSLGANLGFSRVSPDYPGAEAGNFFSWPAGLDVAPGLRVGFAGDNPTHEIYFDTGLLLFSSAGISSRSFTTTANYQYNFTMSGSVAPFITAGGGIILNADKNDTTPTDESATAGMFGGGLGIRHKMGNGHGTLRAELRFDRTTEGTDSGNILILKSNVITAKLGFDLWDK